MDSIQILKQLQMKHEATWHAFKSDPEATANESMRIHGMDSIQILKQLQLKA